MKLLCDCGHVIVDQTDYLKYKADIIPDTHNFKLFESLVEIAASFAEAIAKGERKKWIDNNFDHPSFHELDDNSLLSDRFAREYMDSFKFIYQCESSGTLYIQKWQRNEYAVFKPDSDNWKNVLTND